MNLLNEALRLTTYKDRKMVQLFTATYLNKKIDKAHVRLCFDPKVALTIASNSNEDIPAIDTMLISDYCIKSGSQLVEMSYLACFVCNVIDPSRVNQISRDITVALDQQADDDPVEVTSSVIDSHIADMPELDETMYRFFKLIYMRIFLSVDFCMTQYGCSLLDMTNDDNAWYWRKAFRKIIAFYRKYLRSRNSLHAFELYLSDVSLPKAVSEFTYLGDLSKPRLDLLPKDFISRMEGSIFTNTNKTISSKLAPSIISYSMGLGDCLVCVLLIKEGWFIFNDLSNMIDDEYIERILDIQDKPLEEIMIIEMIQHTINAAKVGTGLTLVLDDKPTNVTLMKKKSADIIPFKSASIH